MNRKRFKNWGRKEKTTHREVSDHSGLQNRASAVIEGHDCLRPDIKSRVEATRQAHKCQDYPVHQRCFFSHKDAKAQNPSPDIMQPASKRTLEGIRSTITPNPW